MNVVVIPCDVSGLKVVNNVGVNEVDCGLLVVSIVIVEIAGSLVSIVDEEVTKVDRYFEEDVKIKVVNNVVV